MKPSIYLAGPINGQSHTNALGWREYVTEKLHGVIDCYSPLRDAKSWSKGGTFGAATFPDNALYTDQGITTRDRLDVMRCDALVVNFFGVTKVSIGTCIELGWADAWRKPVVMIMEKNNVHDHSMVRGISGYIVTDLDEAVTIVKRLLTPGEIAITEPSKRTFDSFMEKL
jgi:nucleoside 2-deoxyribosyltransferase